jgi:hypothetical protein
MGPPDCPFRLALRIANPGGVIAVGAVWWTDKRGSRLRSYLGAVVIAAV